MNNRPYAFIWAVLNMMQWSGDDTALEIIPMHGWYRVKLYDKHGNEAAWARKSIYPIAVERFLRNFRTLN